MTKSSRAKAGRERRAFTVEFKQEAVRLMHDRRAAGVSLAQIGREVAVRPDLLRRWARQLEGRRAAPAGVGEVAGGVLPSLDAEVRRLRRENAVLRQERDFAKKAAVFFAKESR